MCADDLIELQRHISWKEQLLFPLGALQKPFYRTGNYQIDPESFLPADAPEQPYTERLFLDRFDPLTLLSFVYWSLKVINTLFETFCLSLVSSRMDEEAQKRADAEGNLVAFRKVNAQLTAPCNLIDLCPQAQITGQMDSSISNYCTIVTL